MFRYPTLLAAFLASVTFLPPVAAQQAGSEPGRTILILDASGSMWGQIEGQAKITIAQSVLRDLLERLPETEAIGLAAYGHRRKGDCSDIETLAAPTQGNRAALVEAINRLRPKGKTPMTEAVAQAARTLRHTEARATVILVSDGIETCDADPCAVAAELEASGVDFTAHVVGFDVDDARATAQLQCVAENTGGQYRDARTADDLGRALEDVMQAPKGESPREETVIIPPITIEGPNEATAGSVVTFTVKGDGEDQDFLAVHAADGSQISYVTMVNGQVVKVQMPTQTGDYEMRYLSNGNPDHLMATHPITLTEARPALTAPASAPAYSQIEVTWQGPGTEWDFLVIAKPDDQGGYLTASDYLVSGGNPIAIFLPETPGEYELRYIYGENREILVRQPIRAE